VGRDEGSTECLEEGTDEGIEDGFLVWFLKAVITELLTNVGLLDDSKESFLKIFVPIINNHLLRRGH